MKKTTFSWLLTGTPSKTYWSIMRILLVLLGADLHHVTYTFTLHDQLNALSISQQGPLWFDLDPLLKRFDVEFYVMGFSCVLCQKPLWVVWTVLAVIGGIVRGLMECWWSTGYL